MINLDTLLILLGELSERLENKSDKDLILDVTTEILSLRMQLEIDTEIWNELYEKQNKKLKAVWKLVSEDQFNIPLEEREKFIKAALDDFIKEQHE